MSIFSLLWAWLRGRREAPAPVPPAPPPAVATAQPVALGDLTPLARRTWLLANIVDPVLADLARRGVKSDDRARIMLLAITGQEADARHRDQLDRDGTPGAIGPATGLLQFERGGGVRGVRTHPATARVAADLLRERGIAQTDDAAWRALVLDDRLAFAFGRLLLLTDPSPLPYDPNTGWRIYVRTWRPGAYLRSPYSLADLPPEPLRWRENWNLAEAAVLGRRPGATVPA